MIKQGPRQKHEGASRLGEIMADREKVRVCDLAERTATFGEAAIRLARSVKIDPVTERLVPQLVAAATSVGANYAEAEEAESRRDFRHKLAVCAKECRESKHFIRMVAAAQPTLAEDARRLYREAHELVLILAAGLRSLDRRDGRPNP